MTRENLINICRNFGLSVTEDMTVAELEKLLSNASSASPEKEKPETTDASHQSALPTKSDAIFHKMDATKMDTFSNVKIVFIAGSKYGAKLIVRKPGSEDAHCIYVFPETVSFAGVTEGDVVTILAEERTNNGKTYWNATALSKKR